MSKIIDGKKLAEKIKDKITKEIYELKGPRPSLAIILIGERPDSELYIRLKEREAKKVGIDTHLYRCAENTSELEILEMIKCLNEDKIIDAILMQLPLPAPIDTDTIIMALDPAKDVDGFHPDNLEKLLKNCDVPDLMPPVFATVLEMLNSIKYEIKNKRVAVISNSDIFGKSLAHVLKCRGAMADAIKADDKSLIEQTKQADILITAAGKPKFIKKDMIKQDAVVIDVGITKQGEKFVGDVDFDDVEAKAGYITPVPGGVGPMTIAMAFKNTIEIYKKRKIQ
ncbi:MAG: bifunctional 5,10-methylenetetrahydrofolate dehydrogenase/5,10-methenyltetrahydrofolate cyclohydrolase [Candidatus Falkowbacteria bacterium]